jgi:signal transduction histidine kinase
MNGAVEMERDRECRLLLNDLNDILSEQCLEQRVRCRYLNDPVQELAECINQLLDICERAVTGTLNIENDYRTMRAELQSNIRNPLSCIKTSCFLINSLAEKENIQSEKLREYLQIIEKAAEDIESALK